MWLALNKGNFEKLKFFEVFKNGAQGYGVVAKPVEAKRTTAREQATEHPISY